ncbi:MAG: COG1361 S-layer family protein [Natronomonas sp.]
MRRSGRGAVLMIAVGIVLLASMVVVASAQTDDNTVRGEPKLDVYVPHDELTPGTADEVTLQIANDGKISWGGSSSPETVTTARNVRVEIEDIDSPLSVETETQAIGAVTTDKPGEAEIVIRVPNDSDPGEYSIDVRLRYSHTSSYSPSSGVTQDRTRSVRRTVDIVVEDRPRFELQSAGSDVQVGGAGTIAVEVENVGSADAHDLDVTVEPTSPNVVIGDPASDTARIYRLDAGNSTIVPYDVLVRSGTTARNFTMDAHVEYDDPDGIRSTQGDRSFGFQPVGEQDFTVDIDASTLRVGETGTIDGTIRNDGPLSVEDLSLVLDEGQFEPRSRSYSIGELDEGETANFQFRAVVPHSTDPVPQRIDLVTRYRTTGDAELFTNESIHVPVADRRDAVAVRAIDSEFAAGESGVLELEATNQRDVEIRDVHVRLAVDDPLESDFRSTVISSLEPGETGRVAFDLEVDSDAPESQYPTTIEIEYNDPDDEPATVRPSIVEVVVTESDGAFVGIELLVFAVVAILAVGVFVWLYRR